MGPPGPVVSTCAAPAKRLMDGRTQGRLEGRQMLGYVMSFAEAKKA